MDALLPVAAAINAAMLAAALAVQSWRRKAAPGLFAASFLATAAAAIAMIAIDHAGVVRSTSHAPLFEAALTFASGPLFLLFVAASLGARIDRGKLAFALAILAAAALAAAQHYSMQFVSGRLVLVQMGFTAAAAILVFRRGDVSGGTARARRFAMAAIAVLALVHVAQLVRIMWPDAATLRNIVPQFGAAAFMALSAAVYFGGRLGLLEPLTEPPSIATDAMRELVARLEARLTAGLLKKADLTSAEAAAAVGVPSEILAEAVRTVTGGSFPARLQRLRVEEAQRLLADPREARSSMEAIGMLAGFGSRSAFYQAFGEIVGMSPAAYRKGLAQKHVQNRETGQH